jgi:hypothetical protein
MPSQSLLFLLAMLCFTAAAHGLQTTSKVPNPLGTEVVILSPRPSQQFTSNGSIPVSGRLVFTDPQYAEPSPSWALSITLDDRDSTVVPGITVFGEMPDLHDGWHTLALALVDSADFGKFLGPRARVSFLVGDISDESLEARILSPAAGIVLLQQASKSSEKNNAVHIDAQVTGWRHPTHDMQAVVIVNGVDVTNSSSWNQGRWSSTLAGFREGLHWCEVIVHVDGKAVSHDKVFFEARVQAHSYTLAGDDDDFCQALPGHCNFTAPALADSVRHTLAVTHKLSKAQSADEMLNAYCRLHASIMHGGAAKRFLVLEAGTIPLGNRLQFVASGAMLALLTGINQSSLPCQFGYPVD